MPCGGGAVSLPPCSCEGPLTLSVLIENPSPKEPLNQFGLLGANGSRLAPLTPETESALCLGLHYEADPCNLSCSIPVDPCNIAGDACFSKPAEGSGHTVYSCQTGVLAVEDCDTCYVHDKIPERVARVRNDLLRTRSHKLEYALSSGVNMTPAAAAELNDVEIVEGPFSCFAEPEVIADAPCGDVLGGMAELAQYQASCSTAKGTLHVPYVLLAHLTCCGLLQQTPRGLEDVYGNTVIVGTGYTGQAPDGTPADPGSAWIYLTGPVNVWGGTILDLTDVVRYDDNGDLINKSIIRSEQGFVITVDPCCFAAIPILFGGC